MKQTFRYGIFLELCFSIFVAVLLYLFAEPIMRLFTSDLDVIAEGVRYLHLIAFMYPAPALTNGFQGYFRGTGDLRITLISSIINMVFRCLSCYVLLYHFGFRFSVIPWSYLAGWIAMMLYEVPILILRWRRTDHFEQED